MAMQAEHTQPHTQLSGTESDRRAPVRRCGGAGGALSGHSGTDTHSRAQLSTQVT